MAPLHNRFELCGWPEASVTVRFRILSGLSSALAAAVFYSDALRLVQLKRDQI